MTVAADDTAPAASGLVDTAAVAALADIPKPGQPPAAETDAAPDKPARKSRSGTSGAERARRAREAKGTKPATPDKPVATPRVGTLEKQLRDRFVAVAELLSIVQPADAAVLKHNGPKLAKLFATKYPKLGAQLARLLGLADELDGLALLGLVVGLIADNHGLLPAKASAGVKLGAMLTGIAPPAKLTADLAESAGELGALAALFTGAGATDETAATPPAATAA